jgi:protein FAM32A
MPGDEYASTIRGGLKLKGAKPSGVTKKKKKEKSKHKDSSDGESSKKSLLQKALEDEDAAAAAASSSSSSKDLIRGEGKEGEGLSEAELRELDPRGDDGKTASERQYEEMRRKRVRPSFPLPFNYILYHRLWIWRSKLE